MKKTIEKTRFSVQPQAALSEVKHRLPMLSLESGYHVQDVMLPILMKGLKNS